MNQVRYSILSLIILVAFSACESQKKVSDIIYDKYSEQPGFSMIALPPNTVELFVDESKKSWKPQMGSEIYTIGKFKGYDFSFDDIEKLRFRDKSAEIAFVKDMMNNKKSSCVEQL